MKKYTTIILVGLLLYTSSLFNGFVWDDEVSFGARAELTSSYFRPAMSFVYESMNGLFGAQPFFFHLTSVLFHIITALLIFVLFKRFFKESNAFFLSLIFLVHPALVEAVCFASALQEILFTCIGLGGIILLMKSENECPSPLIIIINLLFSTLALLMKETGVVFFALGFAYLSIFHKKNSHILRLYSAFTIIVLFTYGLVRFGGGNTYVGEGQGLFPIMRVPIYTRLITIPQIILYYTSTIFFPFRLAIAQHFVVRTVDLWQFWAPLGGVLGIVSLIIYANIKHRLSLLLFFSLWIILGLLPHLQLVPLNMTAAERWLYFPTIGVLGMIGVLAERSKLTIDSFKFQVGIVLILTLLFVRSFMRTLDWRTGLALYGSTISKSSSFDIQNNMGVELFRVGKYEEARQYFIRSVELAPYWWVNWNNLGASYEKSGDIGKAKDCYQRSIRNGTYILAYENLAQILVFHQNDKDLAKKFVKEATQLFPGSAILRELSIQTK